MPQFHLTRPVRNLEPMLEVFRLAPRRAATLHMWRCVIPPDRSACDPSRSGGYAGRWHHPADSEALYSAATEDVASLEAMDRRLPGVYPAKMAPLEISGRAVLRLANVADRLRWPLEHLLSDGLGYARAIIVGVMACRAGVDVLIVPSARRPDVDVAVCYMRHAPQITEGLGHRLTITV